MPIDFCVVLHHLQQLVTKFRIRGTYSPYEAEPSANVRLLATPLPPAFGAAQPAKVAHVAAVAHDTQQADRSHLSGMTLPVLL